MLQRIRLIKSVGAFADATPASVHFGNFTLIYGRNTYGKSTLADVFRSLETGNPELVRGRESIPHDGRQQQIAMTFSRAGERENEGVARFERGTWIAPLRESHLIRVFDESFYHSHVFTSRTFSRDTKIAFSSFVLGAQGVAQAQKIALLKKEKGGLGRDINSLTKQAFGDITDLDLFIKQQPEGDIDQLIELKERLTEAYLAIQKQQKAAAEIVIRPEITCPVVTLNVQEALAAFNGVLASCLESVHEDAKAAVVRQVSGRLGGAPDAETWLRQGLRFYNGEDCQFCGQPLSDDAVALIGLYQKCFDDAFERHERSVRAAIEQCRTTLRDFERDVVQEVEVALLRNEKAIACYPELLEVADFRAMLSCHEDIKGRLLSVVPRLHAIMRQLATECAKRGEEKVAAPHKFVSPVDSQLLLTEHEVVQDLLRSYDLDVVAAAARIIGDFKKSVSPDELSKRLAEVIAKGKTIARSIERHKKDPLCKQLVALTARREEITRSIPPLEDALRKEQSDYLDRFFGSINTNFKAFGGNDFTLVKELSRGGHQPVYFMKVKYKGVEVKEENLDKVFSESDRRALALAVFWTGLETLAEEDLRKTVVVLDDPVTSFDDGRVTQTHREVFSLLERVDQVIFLSHYRHGIAQLLKTYDKVDGVKLVEIHRNQAGSTLREGDIDEFVRSEHESMREEIMDFIELKRETMSADLRVFLEQELRLRFGAQLRSNSIANSLMFSERIDAMLDADIISPEVAASLHRWRTTLNPAHHQWMGLDVLDRRNTAKALLSFIYEDLRALPSSQLA